MPAEEQLEIDVDHHDRTALVRVRGELDIATAPRLERVLDDVHDEDVVLDLRGLSYLDSCGVRLLLRRDEAVRRDGHRLTVVQGRTLIRRLLTIMQADRHLDLRAA